ncbi:MAG: SpoIVB peptidase [Clostridia bacterium]
MKKIFIFVALFFVCLFAFPQFAYAETTSPTLEELNNLFFPQVQKVIREKVYLSGKPIGISLDGNGITVIGLNEFVSSEGVVSPAIEAGINIGDIITELDRTKINNVATLTHIANASQGKPCDISFIRGDKLISSKITPRKDVLSKTYKLGIWARDNATGIGTLTYIRNNLQFGSLGHPILNHDTNEILKITKGGIYNCKINGAVKGEKGKAGELKGNFSLSDTLGTLYVNNKYGAYGNVFSLPDDFEQKLYPVLSSTQVKPGNAKVISTVIGDTPREYDIEIIKVVQQTSKSDKGLVVRIVDPTLLELTGGIVQGMSGSPIIQDGAFAGALTHVFINDPTKGYGILAEWMLEN